MKNVLITILAVVAAVAIVDKMANAGTPTRDQARKGVDAKGLTAAQSWTMTNSKGWETALITVDFTHGNNGTLAISCLSDDSITSGATIELCVVASGVCTLTDSSYITASLSADKIFSARLGIGGYEAATCTLTHGGSSDATDIATVTYRMY